ILTDFPVDTSLWPTGFGERRSLLRDIGAFDHGEVEGLDLAGARQLTRLLVMEYRVMDTSRLAVAAALVGLLAASPAVAQEAPEGQLGSPAQQVTQEGSVNFDDGGQAANSPAKRNRTQRNGDAFGPGMITASYARQKTEQLGC